MIRVLLSMWLFATAFYGLLVFNGWEAAYDLSGWYGAMSLVLYAGLILAGRRQHDQAR